MSTMNSSGLLYSLFLLSMTIKMASKRNQIESVKQDNGLVLSKLS